MATRRERVVLELDDQFTAPMARAAAATALLKREVDSLGKSNLNARRGISDVERETDKLGRTAANSGKEIDRYSGRIRVLAEAAVLLAPALVPIGTAVVPAVAGLATGFGAAAVAAGTAILAFHGIGDALRAMNTYQLAPTQANLAAMHAKLEAFGPAGQHFLREVQNLEPALAALKATAQEGLFPGLTDGLDALKTRFPEVNTIIGTVAHTMGHLAREAGHALAGPEWDSFFHSVETGLRPALLDLGHTLGNVAGGLARLWQAFMPVSVGFGRGLEQMSAHFERWAAGLSQTQGFQHFLDYLHTEGPKVLTLLGTLADDLVAIGRAMAPFGGPVLTVLTEFAKVLASIANSPIGTPVYGAVAAFLLLNRVLSITESRMMASFGPQVVTKLRTAGASVRTFGADLSTVTTGLRSSAAEVTALNEASARIKGNLLGLGKGAAVLGGVALVASGAADKFGLTNTATLALAGSMMGPLGAGAGAAVGAFLDMRANAAATTAKVNDLKTALDTAVASGNKAQALTAANKILDLSGRAKSLPGPLQDQFHGLDALAARARSVKSEINNLNGAQRLAAASAGAYGAAEQKAARETLANRNAASAAGQQFLTLGKNVNNAKVSLDKWIHQLAAQARALTEFGDNARTASNRGLRDGLIKQLEAAGPAGALRMKQLADGTQQQINRANRAWESGQRAIQGFIKTEGGLKPTDVQVNTEHAIAELASLKAWLNSLHDKTLTVTVLTNHNHGAAVRSQLPSLTPADGATVPGPRQPYGDKVLAMLAPGEEVISNRYGQADRHRDLLKAINAGHFADGGTTGHKTPKHKRNPLTLGEYRAATNSLNLTSQMTVAEANREIHSFAVTIRRDGGSLRDGLKKLTDQVDATIEKLRPAISQLDSLRSQKSQAVSNTVQAFTHDPFGGSLADFATQVTADRNDARKMREAITRAKKHGLSGRLASQLEASGNVLLAQQFAGESRSQIRHFERLLAQAGQQRRLTGRQAGSFFDPAIHELRDEVRHLRTVLNKQEKAIEALPKHVEHGAEKGSREGSHKGTSDGMKGRSRSTANRTRVGR